MTKIDFTDDEIEALDRIIINAKYKVYENRVLSMKTGYIDAFLWYSTIESIIEKLDKTKR